MKKRLSNYVFALLMFAFLLAGCDNEPSKVVAAAPEPEASQEARSDSLSPSFSAPPTENGIPSTESKADPGVNVPTAVEMSDAPVRPTAFLYSDVPPYTWAAYVPVNSNIPYFTENELTTNEFEVYSTLDILGRCGVAFANVSHASMATEPRGSIGQVKPSGWNTVKYDFVDGKYLYNRCHLIGYQLTAENANECNLITGTRYLNIEGMLPFENMVADYVKETGNHVAYRVTPIFEEDNLLAFGVLMEGYSIEDQGDGICFCVFAYNVQPGVSINYATGDSQADGSIIVEVPSQTPEQTPGSLSGQANTPAPTESNTPSQVESPAPVSSQDPAPSVSIQPAAANYIANKNTKKFHYPNCSSVNQMNESNKWYYSGTADELVQMGYDPCKKCKP